MNNGRNTKWIKKSGATVDVANEGQEDQIEIEFEEPQEEEKPQIETKEEEKKEEVVEEKAPELEGIETKGSRETNNETSLMNVKNVMNIYKPSSQKNEELNYKPQNKR